MKKSFTRFQKRHTFKNLILKISSFNGFLLALLFTFSCFYSQGASRYSVATGNWSATSTWSATSGGTGGASVPVAGDNVYIERGYTVTVDISNAACGSITLGRTGGTTTGTGTLTFAISGSPSLTVSGSTVLGGTNTNGSNTGTITFVSGSSFTTGSLQLGNTYGAGVINMTNGGTLTVGGAITVVTYAGNTWTPGTGNVILTATNTLPTTIFTSFNNLTISGGTTTLGVNITLSGNLSINSLATLNLSTFTANRGSAGGGLTVSNGGTLKIGGTNTLPSNYSTHSIGCTSTIEYSGTNQTVSNLNSSQNYGNLTLSGSGIKTFQTGITNICTNLTLSGTASTTTVVGLVIGSNLNIGDGTTFTIAGFNLTVTGSTLVGNGTSGTLTISSATGTKIFTGLVTINSGATWNNSGNSDVTFQGGITNNGTFTAGSGVHTFNTNPQSLTGTLSIPNVTVTSIILNNNNTLTVGTALSGNGSLNQSTGSTLNIGGTSGITTLLATNSGNTVNYTGAAQTVHSNNYYNLTLSGSGADVLQIGTTTINGNLTLSGTVTTTTVTGFTISNNLIIGNGTTFTSAGFDLTVSGTTTVGSGTSGSLIISSSSGNRLFTGLVTIAVNGIWNNSGNSAVTFRGGITNSGTFTAGSGVHTFDANVQGITGTLSIPNVTVTGITLTNNGSLTLTNALTGTGGLTNASSGTLNINLPGSVGITTLTATASGNTVNYGYAGNQNIFPVNYYNLTLSNSGIKTFPSALTISGNYATSGSAVGNLVTYTSSANTLSLGGTGVTNGSWGSSSSPATYKNDTYFSSTTGTINITTGSCSGPTVSITGNSTICAGNTTTLSPTSGGHWVSNNPSVASVTDAGVVTGLSAGSATFTFTQNITYCSATTSAVTVNAVMNGIYTVGPSGNYTTLNAAITALSSTCGISGPVTLVLQSGYTSTSEPSFPIKIPAITGASATNKITIYPAVPGLSITSSNSTGTIQYNGGDYVNFDGRVGGTGTTKDLVIENTNTSGFAVAFQSNSIYNTVQYCTIKGVTTTDNVGVIYFYTGSSGNNNNTIQFCDIRDGTTTPANLIVSNGSTSNNYNKVSDCNIYNWHIETKSTCGILLYNNNSNWTIQNNSFFQQASRNSTADTSKDYYTSAIRINSGNGYLIQNNYIGGSSSNCGGSAMTYTGTGTMQMVEITPTGSTTNTIQNNVFKNINFTTTSHYGFESFIMVGQGSCDILNNIIGDSTTTGNIVYTGNSTGTSGANFHAITVGMSTGFGVYQYTFNIKQNKISGINIGGTGGTEFRGINVQCMGSTGGSPTATYNVSQNVIGSTVTANSIKNTTPNGLTGIISFAGYYGSSQIATCTIDNNTVANLVIDCPYATGTNFLTGIHPQGNSNNVSTNYSYGVMITTNNTIHDLYSNGSIGSGDVSMYGILTNPNYQDGQILRNNRVYNLVNTNSGSLGARVTGIRFHEPMTANNIVAYNYIHNLSLNSTSTSASVYGLNNADDGNALIYNNVVSIGSDPSGNPINNGYPLYGIADDAKNAVTSYYYYNSVYVGGATTGTVSNSYAFLSSSTTGTRVYENNIFANFQAAGTGNPYAISIKSGGTITSDFNNLYNGDVGSLASYNGTNCSDLYAWRAASGQGTHSVSGPPYYVNPGGSTSTIDMHITDQYSFCRGKATAIGSVTVDYDGVSRKSPPDIGAFEFPRDTRIIWLGGCGVSPTTWEDNMNWSITTLPTLTDAVQIPLRKYEPISYTFDQNRCNNIIIDNGANVTVNPGKSVEAAGTLTINGPVGVKILSSNAGTGQFKFASMAGTGTALVQQYETYDCWHYITQPVTHCLSGVFLHDWLRYYYEPAGKWSAYIVPTTIPMDTVMQGYEVWRPDWNNLDTKNFTGTLNSGNVTRALTRTPATGGGWNLTGNPYVCGIDLTSSALTWTNVDKTVYYWDPVAGNYATYVVGAKAGSGSRYAPGMQGFFVHVNSSYLSGTFGVNNSAMTLTSQGFYKNTEVGYEILSLVATSGQNSYFDKTVICFNPLSSPSFEPDLDGYKWFGNSTAPQIYTKADVTAVSVNSLPFTGSDMTIPLYFSCGLSGVYVLAFDDPSLYPPDQPIFLEDLLLGTITEFSPEMPYKFSYTAGANPGRFILHFEKPHPNVPGNDPLSNNDIQHNSFHIYSYGKTVYVRSEFSSVAGDVRIYNMLGNEVFTGKLEPATINRYETSLPDGIYVVNLITQGSTVNQKVVIK